MKAAEKLRELMAGSPALPYEVDVDCYGEDTFDGNATIDITNAGTELLAHFDSGTSDFTKARESQEFRDATFIVAAVNALPALLDIAEAAADFFSLDKGGSCTGACGGICAQHRLQIAITKFAER